MFPSRDISGIKKLPENLLRFNLAFSVLCLLFITTKAGQFTTSDFSNVSDSSNVLIRPSDAVIGPKDTIAVAMLKDEIITGNTVDSSYAVDLVVSVGDTFCYFWSEFDGALHHVMRREVELTEFGYTMLAQQTVFQNFTLLAEYLHASRGTARNAYISSFYDSLFQRVASDTDSLIYSAKPNNSISHVRNDTFCIVFKESNSKLQMRKVKMTGGNLAFVDGAIPDKTIGTNAMGPPGNFSNNSIAVDSSGNLFVTATRGASASQKNLDYILTNTEYDINDGGTIANSISLNTGGDVKYDDAPVVSYADKKFAAVYWTSAGIFLHDATVSGNPPAVTASNNIPVIAGNSFRAPTLATNGKKLVIIWKNLATQRLEGKLLTINNGALSAVPGQTEVYSDPATTVGDHGPELNAVMNSKGDIAIAWKQNKNAVGAIWTERGVVYSNAEMTSAVESVTVIPNDSLVFLPGSIDTTLNKGAVTCSLQVGPTTNTSSGWTSWLTLGSAADLMQNTKGTDKYFRFKTTFTRHATDSIKSPILSGVTINWNIKPRIQTIDSIKVNGSILSGVSGFGDSIDIISHSDTVDCYFTVYDGDPEDTSFVSVPWDVQPDLAKDTASGAVNRPMSIRLLPKTVWDTVYNCSFIGNDNHLWSANSKNLIVRARKAVPVITTVTYDGLTISDSAAVNIVIGKLSTVNVTLERYNIVAWNMISYRFITDNFDTSFTTASQLSFRPAEDDNTMQIITSDQFGAADTFFLFFKFPKYTTDSLTNSGYFNTKKKLSDSLSYVIGADLTDTLYLPILNTGNDTLKLDSIFFRGSTLAWLKLGVPQPGGIVYFDSLTSSQNISTVRILPDSIKNIVFTINLQSLSGDGVVYDTVRVFTNDPVYPVDTIRIVMEYNDIPTIAAMEFDYVAGKPYWLSKRKRGKRGYVFPPHAKIKFTFSEPMDSGSATGSFMAYSIFDSATTGSIDTIHYTQSWRGNDTLLLSPNYSTASTYFNGLRPPTGLYIPTDSIGLIIKPNLTDRATTPSGPNVIDFHNDYVSDTTDTLINLRVDSINFTLDSISPKNLATAIKTDAPIVLSFSSPVYPGTIDTATYNNRNLYIYTRYNSYNDSLRQVIFDSVYITGNKVTYVPGKRFFYGDSVYCIYKGIGARDTLGYSVDLNKDGIPAGLFDSVSTADDYTWVFHVEDILNDSVFPDSAANNVSINTPISLTFSAPLFPGTIDTTLTGNRSLTVTSRYSEGDTLGFDSVMIGTNTATFYLSRRLFYSDSVACEFNGLVTQDTSFFSIDLAGDTIYSTGKKRFWFFNIEELSLESVSPDSAGNAGVRDPVTMTFSGPISPMVFDTTSDADSNRSIALLSRYSGGKRLHLRNISFSADSSTVTILPDKAYYSYDSVFCQFAGFLKNYSYNSNVGLIPNDTSEVINTYSWYFLTGKDGFYTFPNPYKPGSNKRHEQFGGIMFKNLHAITATRGNVTHVQIKVFNINTHPVFESGTISFQEGSATDRPEWFWNTRNNRGSLIASGVYFYAIYDLRGKVLLKGKLLIVR